MVEQRAGLSGRMHPLHGHSREAPACGQLIQDPRAPRHTTDGTPALVADRALESEDTRHRLSETRLQWRTRVPATVSAAPAALAHADPPTMAPLLDG